MKRTQKHQIESVAASYVDRRRFLAGVLIVCGGLAAVMAADQAQPSDTNTVSATAASSPTSDLPEPLPLMIPDDVWKQLTLTDEQQAQLTTLRTSLYSDQLATVRSITLQGETLRLALIEAESGKREGAGGRQEAESGKGEGETTEDTEHTETATASPADTVAKLQGQILELTTPLLTRYDQFVVDAAILLDSPQRTELAKAAKDILAEKRLEALAASLGLTEPSTLNPEPSTITPLDSLVPIPLSDGDRRDDDSDGQPSAWELEHKLAPLDSKDTGIDTDGDWLVNYTEYLLNLDPQNPDDLDELPAEWKLKLAQNAADRAERVAQHDREKQKENDAKKSAASGGGSGNSSDADGKKGSGVVVRIINPPHGSTVK